jgi:hypothetical protein
MMTLIETITVGSGGAASIEFTGIPQDGVDLLVLVSNRASNINQNLTFNSDTAGNYDWINLRGTDTLASSQSGSSASYIKFYAATETTQTANTFGSASILISNYTSATSKSVSIDGASEHNGGTGTSYRNIVAGSYTTTSAITSLAWNANGGTTAEHSTASLYIIS